MQPAVTHAVTPAALTVMVHVVTLQVEQLARHSWDHPELAAVLTYPATAGASSTATAGPSHMDVSNTIGAGSGSGSGGAPGPASAPKLRQPGLMLDVAARLQWLELSGLHVGGA